MNKFLKQNILGFFLSTLVLAAVNYLIFITPFKIALDLQRVDLIAYYLFFYIVVSIGSSLIISRKKIILIMIILLLLSPFLWNLTISSSEYFSKPYPSRQIDKRVYLNFQSDNLEVLKSKDFCFDVLVPTYLPNSPYPMYVSKVEGSAESCGNQIVAITYNPCSLDLYVLPKSYDFNFRREQGFENFQAIRKQALDGTRIEIGNGIIGYYINSINSLYFSNFWKMVSCNEPELLYWETDNSIIFFRFTTEYYYAQEEFLNIARSMRKIN